MRTPIEDGLAMTFAGLAYAPPENVVGYVSAGQATSGWTVSWLPESPSAPAGFDNFAYMASSPDGSEAVLAIRGTYPNPLMRPYWDDFSEDNPLQPMQEWPGGGRIGGGTSAGLAKILCLKAADGSTIVDVAARLSKGTRLTVTGHSLGGTLAPVMALQLSELFPSLAVDGASFAGMTPGDGEFARLFDAPGAPRIRRVANNLDTVAYGWDRVLATHFFYQPKPQGGPLVQAKVRWMAKKLEEGGYDYTAVGIPVELCGELTGRGLGCDLVAYLFEMLHQHLPNTYLALLGAPPLPFAIGFGTTTHSIAPVDPLRAPPVHD